MTTKLHSVEEAPASVSWPISSTCDEATMRTRVDLDALLRLAVRQMGGDAVRDAVERAVEAEEGTL